jgi:hypothetical protein
MAASRSRRASGSAFESIYGHGFVRVAVCTPRVEVASPSYNAAQTLALARQAAAEQAALALFPELGLSAYSNEDLFQQDALLDASLAALESLAEGSRDLGTLILAGLPLRVDDRLFNCAVALQRGRVLGVVPGILGAMVPHDSPHPRIAHEGGVEAEDVLKRHDPESEVGRDRHEVR